MGEKETAREMGTGMATGRVAEGAGGAPGGDAEPDAAAAVAIIKSKSNITNNRMTGGDDLGPGEPGIAIDEPGVH